MFISPYRLAAAPAAFSRCLASLRSPRCHPASSPCCVGSRPNHPVTSPLPFVIREVSPSCFLSAKLTLHPVGAKCFAAKASSAKRELQPERNALWWTRPHGRGPRMWKSTDSPRWFRPKGVLVQGTEPVGARFRPGCSSNFALDALAAKSDTGIRML